MKSRTDTYIIMNSRRHFVRSQKGSLVEYALLACLVAMIGIVSITALGKKVENTFCVKIAGEIGTAGGGQLPPGADPCDKATSTKLD